MTTLKIGCSSFLLSTSKAWGNIASRQEVQFGRYGDWSKILLNSTRQEAVAIILFLDDILNRRSLNESELKDLFKSFFTLLKKRLLNAKKPTIVAFSSFDFSNLICRAKSIGTNARIHYWFMGQLEHLATIHSQLAFVDLDKEFAIAGMSKVLDKRNWYFAHCRVSYEGLNIIANTLVHCVFSF